VTPPELKELYERTTRAMARRPAFGRSSGQARIRLGDGGSCEVESDDRTVRVDSPVSEGGGGTAPSPGQLMRASVGACLAIGYRLWGARLQVPVDGVEVDMVCEFDARGQLGVAEEVAVGWQRIRFDVTIVSAASAAEVRRMVETADRLSPMLANISPSVERVHRLTVVRPRAEAVAHG
jgi:uncharacterized OsmC-like protein